MVAALEKEIPNYTEAAKSDPNEAELWTELMQHGRILKIVHK